MPLRPDLPTSLVSVPRRTRRLRAAGVSKAELAGPLWTPQGRGVHLWSATVRADPVTRILAVAELMPTGAAIGGWAALHLLGVRDLDGRTGPGARTELPVTVCIGPVGRMRSRPGLVVDRSTLLDEDRAAVDGIEVTTAERSCLDIMRWSGVEEGMVAGDAAARFGATTVGEVREFVARHPGMRGIPAARLAAALLDEHAESCPESRLRYVWVVRAGLPVPLVNPDLLTLDGDLLGRPDLLDPEAALVGEYDGSDHRTLQRATSDNVRAETFELRNLTLARVTALDLWPRRDQLVGRLRDRYAAARARDRDRDGFAIRRRG